MTEADIEAVVAIENVIHAHPWTSANFKDSLAAGYECWIAWHAREVAAYGVLLVAAGEGHLLNLSVATPWQRKGLGSEFASFFIKLGRDYDAARIYLEVRPSNAAARALYAGKGFAEVGTRRDYYPAPDGREDALIMELNLK
ncbi:MAG TPA: ribosomal protein S18-alanine N-acetyltransferase [Burkholderiales bacterium]|jgi:ribosomal-protein-alanine N-acetyltransferase|nr:ribosomal protein S18-alanine N-acetyltransferase [Burkholderiales bacterium]